MDKTLKELYTQLLSTKLSDSRTVYDRINPSDLCIASHHEGKHFKNGLLIYGQAMNGWQNDNSLDVDSLIEQTLLSSTDHTELYTRADPRGWQDKEKVNSKPASYYYKRSKFWKLNYQVITNVLDQSFNDFYVKNASEEEMRKLLDNAWSQTATWSNLYKISYSEGGNPDDKIIKAINDISLRIILREIEILKPTKILFNTGEDFFARITSNRNIFNLTKIEDGSNVLYKGVYTYSSNAECKIVVCRRPDTWKLHYTNADIVNEAKEILDAFNSI